MTFLRWQKGSSKYSLHPFCLCLDTPNEADCVLIWGLFYLDGQWHFGWPEVI